MNQLWHMIVRVYLLIPYSTPEAQMFREIHKFIAWWMPGALAFGIVPVVYVVVWASSLMLGGFKWYNYHRLQHERAMPEARKYAYYSFWIVYAAWLPLPWPRVALLMWILVLRTVIKSEVTRRRRRSKWNAQFDQGLKMIAGQ